MCPHLYKLTKFVILSYVRIETNLNISESGESPFATKNKFFNDNLFEINLRFTRRTSQTGRTSFTTRPSTSTLSFWPLHTSWTGYSLWSFGPGYEKMGLIWTRVESSHMCLNKKIKRAPRRVLPTFNMEWILSVTVFEIFSIAWLTLSSKLFSKSVN